MYVYTQHFCPRQVTKDEDLSLPYSLAKREREQMN